MNRYWWLQKCSGERERLGQPGPEPGLCAGSGVIADGQKAEDAGKRPLHGFVDDRD